MIFHLALPSYAPQYTSFGKENQSKNQTNAIKLTIKQTFAILKTIQKETSYVSVINFKGKILT